MCYLTERPDRSLIRISGPDRFDFLQGLITNDIAHFQQQERQGQEQQALTALAAALLSPQGKVFAEFLIFKGRAQDSLDLQVETNRSVEIVQRLSRYRLRSQIALDHVDAKLGVIWALECEGQERLEEGHSLGSLDPRSHRLGSHIVLDDDEVKSQKLSKASLEDWKAHRLRLGISEGAEEMGIEELPALSANLDRVAAIDWQKGCYVGQEVTARSHYRGLVKRRLASLALSPDSGDIAREALMRANLIGCDVVQGDRKVGQIRSVAQTETETLALAYLSVDCLQDQLLIRVSGMNVSASAIIS